jgi:nicotinate-nucleotide pyrophosphorylase (carboxylating)
VSHPEIFEGVRVKKGQAIAVIRHNARVILACERVILNLMQRMSGISTMTREYVDAISGTGARVLDTRKTIPGLRILDKYAVRCGGGENHRLDLSDGILIKNNHISLGGGIEKVLQRAHELRKPGQTIDIEVRTFDELERALDNGAESLLLDNMTPAEVKKAVGIVRGRGLTIPIEASGGILLENIRNYALAGVDYISVGALTHSAVAVDLSMKITAEIY